MSKPKRPVSRDSDPAASGKTDSALRTSGRESNDFDMELDEEDTRALREDLACDQPIDKRNNPARVTR